MSACFGIRGENPREVNFKKRYKFKYCEKRSEEMTSLMTATVIYALTPRYSTKGGNKEAAVTSVKFVLA